MGHMNSGNRKTGKREDYDFGKRTFLKNRLLCNVSLYQQGGAKGLQGYSHQNFGWNPAKGQRLLRYS
jgi:hypothetical protein